MYNRDYSVLILWSLCVFSIQISFAQDQRLADELKLILEADTVFAKQRLDLLKNLAFNEITDFEEKQSYAQMLITLAEEHKDASYYSEYLYYGYYIKGDAHQFKGEIDDALVSYIKSAEIAATDKSLLNIEGAAYGAIGDIYVISENHRNAMLYYDKSISTLRKTEDTIALASIILNAGDALLTNKSYDSAMVYFKESGQLFEKANYTLGKAYNLGNMGMVHAYTGKSDIAERSINEAIDILEEHQDFYPISVYLMAMSDIYIEQQDYTTATDYAKKSLDIAKKYGLKEQLVDANKNLADLYEENDMHAESLKHYKDYITYRDSIINIETVKRQADVRTEFEVSQKQIEVELWEQRTKTQRVIIGFTAVLLIGGLWFYRIISKEKKKSDKLLLNILPEETAAELKANGIVKAREYDSVTVFFSDFKGFTSYSENLSPEELVKTVSFYFSKFDEIIDKHGLERIKTIGDAYMCLGGIHDNKESHPQRMIAAALEISEFVKETKKDTKTDHTFDIRIGVHTGPVVAGVVGTKKFAYDIWGDTVNVASRMETMSEPGRVNISEDTFLKVKDYYHCESRGEISIKNRGKIPMYFVNGPL